MLKQHLDKLSKTLNQESLREMDEEGFFSGNFEGAGEIYMKENSDSGITFFATLSPLPQNNAETIALRLMEANLLGKETGGALLGLDKDGKNITLTSFLFDSTNYKEFHDALEDFANFADCWRDEVLQFQNKEIV